MLTLRFRKTSIRDVAGHELKVGDYIGELLEPELDLGDTIYKIYQFSPEGRIYAHDMNDPDDDYSFEGYEVTKLSEQEVFHRILCGKVST